MQKKYYTVYATINLLNERIYVGSHATTNPHDEYLGSGASIKRAIQKHGRENFRKEILATFDTPDEMFAYEAEIVDANFVSSSDTYNQKVGGLGGWDHSHGDTHARQKGGRIGAAKLQRRIKDERSINTEWYQKRRVNVAAANATKNKNLVLSDDAKRRQIINIKLAREGKIAVYAAGSEEPIPILKTEVADYAARGFSTRQAPKHKRKSEA